MLDKKRRKEFLPYNSKLCTLNLQIFYKIKRRGIYYIWEEPEEWWQAIRDNWPAYDPDITPTNTMGAVAEMFRSWKGSIRSSHLVRSVAANGKKVIFGNGMITLMKQRDLVDFAVEWIEKNRKQQKMAKK